MSDATPSHDPVRALLESAVSPATAAELGDVEAAVAAFRSSQATPASGTVQGSRAALMRRVPRRAVGVVVGTLLVAGTAAAAATDVIPSWVPVVGHSTSDDSATVDEATDESENSDGSDDSGVTDEPGSTDTDAVSETDDSALIDGTGTPSVVSVPEQSSRDWGWCTAWSKGGGDDPDEDGDGLTVAQRLAILADADGVSVDEYCAVVLATPPSDKNPGGKPATDTTVVDPVEPATTDVTGTTQPNGNGNGGGNGNGNGNGGQNGSAGQGKGNGSASATTAAP